VNKIACRCVFCSQDFVNKEADLGGLAERLPAFL
jgi:hypothetical protein